MVSTADRVDVILKRHGTTYAQEAGIKVADKPSPLYQLLVLSTLLSARISSDIGVAAAKELFKSGYRTPQRMHDATWQQRVDALGRGHYRRYDESTATMLGKGAELVQDHYSGDLHKVHEQAETAKDISQALQDFPVIGPAGADIFIREVQGIWTDFSPSIDKKIKDGAKSLGLPTSPEKFAALVPRSDLPKLSAACVRASLDKSVAADVNDALG